MVDLNFEDIDIYNIGSWPLYLKVIVVAAVCALIILFCNWLFISGKLETLSNLKAEEVRLKTFYQTKQSKLIDIEDYKDQVDVIESRLSKLTKKLPGENELPSIINQISLAGHASGLSFKEIKILPENKFRYYVELPIKIKAEGDYHRIADFISKVSSMPRVITFHDLSVDKLDKNQVNPNQGLYLKMEVLAKTYRYLQNSSDSDNEGDEIGTGVKTKSK